jgi:hypothetical protein
LEKSLTKWYSSTDLIPIKDFHSETRRESRQLQQGHTDRSTLIKVKKWKEETVATYNWSSEGLVFPLGIKILFDRCTLVHFLSINGKDDEGIGFARLVSSHQVLTADQCHGQISLV